MIPEDSSDMRIAMAIFEALPNGRPKNQILDALLFVTALVALGDSTTASINRRVQQALAQKGRTGILDDFTREEVAESIIAAMAKKLGERLADEVLRQYRQTRAGDEP